MNDMVNNMEILLQEINKYYDLDLDIIRFQNVIEPVGEKQIINEQGKESDHIGHILKDSNY